MQLNRDVIRHFFKISSISAFTLICLWIYVLAYPSFLFAYSKSYENFHIHSDLEIGVEIDNTISEVKSWLDPIEIYNPNTSVDIYLCNTQNQFEKLSQLTLRSANVMGLNLPELNNCIINLQVIKNFGELTKGLPVYHSREGSVSHVIAHELMHQYIADTYGFIKSRKLPTWKIEGYCEYGANYVRVNSDRVSLSERYEIYENDSEWNSISQVHRNHYLWGMIIEYLTIDKGLSFNQVVEDSITFEDSYNMFIKYCSRTTAATDVKSGQRGFESQEDE